MNNCVTQQVSFLQNIFRMEIILVQCFHFTSRTNINVDIPPRGSNLPVKDIEVVSYADVA